MSYPPGVTQWRIDYYAGGYDEQREDEEPEPDWPPLQVVSEFFNMIHGGACFCRGGEFICSPDCYHP